MAKALTAAAIEKFKPDPKKRREIPDGGLPGLYFIIQPSGARSWAVRYRHGGKPRKYTIGNYPAFSLKEVRKAASETLRKASEGEDPAEEKKRAKKETKSERNLFATIVEDFLTRHVHVNSRPRYAQETERMLRQDILPIWGKRRIQEIAKRDVIELLDGIIDAGRGLTANHILAAIRKLFNWSIERGIIDASPCNGVKAPLAVRKRDRILNDDELRWLWKATEKDGYPFGSHVRLLLLTGQRRNEVAGITQGEISDTTWNIPGERTKNGEPHEVPLSDATCEVIGALPRIHNTAGYLFCTNGRTHISGFSRAKARLDSLMLAEAQREAAETGNDPAEVAIPRWTLHDLRRTVASNMARLGIALPVIEKVLNHTSGSFSGIVAVYQRHEFSEEKQQALEAWAAYVESLTSEGPASKFVPMRDLA